MLGSQPRASSANRRQTERERNEYAEVITETEGPTLTQLLNGQPDTDERTEPEGLDVYADALLSRLRHDCPVSGPFGSVQRTPRRNRSLKNGEGVLETLEAAGIDREHVLGVDRDKVDDAVEVRELSESDVYDVDARESGARPRSTRNARRRASRVSRTNSPPPMATKPRNSARKSRNWKTASRS
jgi:hypothetical protein